VHPSTEALKIAILYGVIGASWILLSDNLSSKLADSQANINSIQTYKGWFYVFATMIMVYILIRNRLLLFHEAAEKIYENYEDLIILEEDLRQEKELSQSIFNNAPTLTIIMDKNLSIVRFSPFAEEITGYSKEEVIGHNIIDIFIPKKLQTTVCDMFDSLSKGIGSNIMENEIALKNGSYIHVLWHNSFLYDSSGKVIGIVSVGTNITERILTEKKLHSLAYFDVLTDLPNRSMMEGEVKSLISEHNSEPFALLFMDIDNFKHINDTLGHASGDLLLRYVANILKYNIKSPDFVGRLSGDEFIIIFKNISDKNDVKVKLDSLLTFLRRSWIIEKHEFFISFSIGISMYPDQGTDLKTLLKKADTAMFSVKSSTKDNYFFYNDEMHEKALNYINMINQLRHAIENEEFTLFYQPLVDLRTGRTIGAEALIRWAHSKKGFISPINFIPIAEETGEINKIDLWAFKAACLQKKAWESQGYTDLIMSINMSAKSISQVGLVEDIRKLLEYLDMTSKNIQIEITETVIMEDLKASIKVLKQLRDLGFKIALDDFGTGYSSLTYLRNLPIDTVKIDRQFIRNIIKENEDELIVKSIIQLAHGLNLKVVAEGIEFYEQFEFLRINECDKGQGYLFGKPMTAEDIEIFF
jgi:diguanylate cyclase (GGDEF)-like protein/PAS domain S-box-containing protein